MSDENAVTPFKPQLNVPQLTLTTISARQTTPEAMTQWLEELPKADIVSLSRELRQFLPQLNQLQLNGAKRLKLLEQLRPLVHYTLTQLSQHYRCQSLELTAPQRQAANMAQSLQNHLAIGYKHVLLEALDHHKPRLISLALHRTLTELSLCLLRASSLLCPMAKELWSELHQLFTLAKHMQLLGQQISDSERPDSGQLNILQLYKRALLFSTANNGQLRQAEQESIFIACGRWSNEVPLSPAPGEGEFSIELDSAFPPQHRSLCATNVPDPELPETRWLLDTHTLCNKLRQAPKRLNALLPAPLNELLVAHLIKVWGPIPMRSSERIPASGTLQLTSGFCASHYVMAGEVNFDPWLDEQGLDWRQRHQDQLKNGAAWNQAFDVSRDETEPCLAEEQEIRFNPGQGAWQEQNEPFVLFEAQLIDSSAGGYSVELQGQLPPRLLAGELLALRASEHSDKKGSHWNLAVIRWLKRLPHQRVRAGLELLPANVRLGAIAVAGPSGEQSHYMRCFILPEQADSGEEPCTVLMPRIRFIEGAQVHLVDRGQARRGRLEQGKIQSPSYSLFRFQPEQKESQQSTHLELDFSY